MGQSIHSTFLRITRCSLWMGFLALIALSNYAGHCADPPDVPELTFTNNTNIEKTLFSKTAQDTMSNTRTKGSTFPTITKPILLIITFSLAITISLYCMILSYLNNQSLIKQCLLLYIYKDLVCICLGLHSLWFLLIITHYLSGYGHDIPRLYAQVLSFVLYVLMSSFLGFMNLVAILKLYMMKKALVDPPMPWGDNESLGINIIRTVIILPVIIFTTTMFLLDTFPKNHLSPLLENNTSILELPKGASIFAIPIIFLFIALIITFLATCYLKPYYESTEQPSIDTGIPSQIQYIGLFTLIMASATFIFMFDLLAKRGRWTFYLSYSVGSFIIPLIMILKSKQLKDYVKSYIFFDMWFLDVKFVIMCLFVHAFVGLCAS